MSEKFALAFSTEHLKSCSLGFKVLDESEKPVFTDHMKEAIEKIDPVVDERRKRAFGSHIIYLEQKEELTKVRKEISALYATPAEERDHEKVANAESYASTLEMQMVGGLADIGQWVKENLTEEEQVGFLARTVFGNKHKPFFAEEMIRLPEDLFAYAKPKLMPRSQIEKTGDVLQYIPYVMLVDKSTRRVLEYVRAKGGGEERLHDMKSVGLGGHVDELVKEVDGQWVAADENDFDLKETLIANAVREVEEEVGYVCTEENINSLRSQISSRDIGVIMSRFSRLGVYDPTNDVGRAHIGIYMVIEVDSNAVSFVPNENRGVDPAVQNQVEIKEPTWRNPQDIFEDVIAEKYDLEPWSRIMMRGMFVQLYLHYYAKHCAASESQS